MIDPEMPEIEADVRIFARFWMDNQARLAAADDGLGADFGDAALLKAMTGAMRPDQIVELGDGDADRGGLGMNDLLLLEPRADLDGLLPPLRPGVLIRLGEVWGDDELADAPEGIQDWNRAVRAFLAGNPDYEVVFFNRMFRRELAELVEATVPRFIDEPGTGLWLRKLGLRRAAV